MDKAIRAIQVNGHMQTSSFRDTGDRATAQNPNKIDDEPRQAIDKLKRLAVQTAETALSSPKTIKVGKTYVGISSSPPSIGIRETTWRNDVFFKTYIFDEKGACTRVIMLKDGEDTPTTSTLPNDTKEGEKLLLKFLKEGQLVSPPRLTR